MEADDVLTYLRDRGVVVHHTARMPTPRDGRQVVVVFLDGDVDQRDLAKKSAAGLPGVLDVIFSGYNKAVMYVVSRPAAAPEPTTPGYGTPVVGHRPH